MSPYYSKSENDPENPIRFNGPAFHIFPNRPSGQAENPSDERVPGLQAEHDCASIEAPAPLRSEKTAVKGE
jgi:hypothetical protein